MNAMSRSVSLRIWSEHPNIIDPTSDGIIKSVTLPRSEVSLYVTTIVTDYLDWLSPNMDPPLYVYHFPGTYQNGRTVLDVMLSGHPPTKYGEIFVEL